MRKILAVAAVLSIPSMAQAADYGKAGVIEVGGEVRIQSNSVAVKPDGGEEATTSIMEVTLAPEVGYFLMDQLELLGRLAISTSSSKPDGGDATTTNGFGLGVGAAYMLPMGGIHVGPRALLGFSSTTSGVEKDTLTYSGPEIRIGGVAKVPFGGGGALGAGLDITYAPQSVSGAGAFKDAKGSATTTGFGLGTSFSVYW